MVIQAFVLARNEEKNIGRCLSALQQVNVPTVVLDSHSTDQTRSLASRYGRVTVETHNYEDHCSTYNKITTTLMRTGEVAIILDADMVVSKTLYSEVERLFSGAKTMVAKAPVAMCVEGKPLHFGSLYPPKPFAFRCGVEHFTALGHTEKLVTSSGVVQTKEFLVHDDRKGFGEFLSTQYRYSTGLLKRASDGQISHFDRIRLSTPFMLVVPSIVSFLLRGGVFSGRAGLVYALDRLIAEAIMYRQALAERLNKVSDRSPSNGR